MASSAGPVQGGMPAPPGKPGFGLGGTRESAIQSPLS